MPPCGARVSVSYLFVSVMMFAIVLTFASGCRSKPGAGDTGGQDATTDSSGNATTNAGTEGGVEADGGSVGIVADHRAVAVFDSIPIAFIEMAKSNYRIFYGHTSHGSQIITGMEIIRAADSRYAFNSGSGGLRIEGESADLGHEGDLSWVDLTRDVLDRAGNNTNVVMWSWCGGVSDNTEGGIKAYLAAMTQLENDYPHVLFVYMTGHLDGTGPNANLYVRNNQIRAYCRARDKILFDFADIESYDPAGTHYPWGSDWCEWCEDWCVAHACPDCDECAHSVCFNCYQKGKAFWWMMARIAGWSGS